MPIFKIALLDVKLSYWQAEVAHIYSFYTRGPKLSLFLLCGRQFLRFQNCHMWGSYLAIIKSFQKLLISFPALYFRLCTIVEYFVHTFLVFQTEVPFSQRGIKQHQNTPIRLFFPWFFRCIVRTISDLRRTYVWSYEQRHTYHTKKRVSLGDKVQSLSLYGLLSLS